MPGQDKNNQKKDDDDNVIPMGQKPKTDEERFEEYLDENDPTTPGS